LILLLILVAAGAYVIGGINGAIITSKYFYRKDIRKYGSGNPGLTNFYRVFGKGGAALVILIDVLKTVAPVLLGGWLFGHFYDMRLYGSEYAGFFVILGHCFPLFYGFRGGKGVMATGTILFFVDWRVALVSWGVFILLLMLTKYVSLAAMIGSIAYPVSHLAFGLGWTEAVIFAALSSMLLILRHKDNIKRLVRGTESRFSFRRKKEA
jgi:glycerol-3-phosphate acyltransferase PlsY